MNKVSDSFFTQLLKWIRTDRIDFERGYTAGFMNANLAEIEPWQVCYLKNVQRRFAMGERA